MPEEKEPPRPHGDKLTSTRRDDRDDVHAMGGDVAAGPDDPAPPGTPAGVLATAVSTGLAM